MTRSDAAPAIPGAISVKDDWEIKRLKWSVESVKNGVWGDDPIGNANDIKCIRVADFNRVKMLVVDIPTIRNVRKSDRNGRLVLPGDLLLEKSGGGEVQPVGAVAMYLGEEPAVCSNFVARVSCAPNTDGRFFLYVHAALYSSRINVRSIKQTSGIQNLDANAYLSEFVAYPPIAVQRDIADFLDRETAEADAFVAKYERLIELLEEKRVALITQAVTKGLDSSVPMRDSGVEWVGEVPHDWKVLSLRRILNTRSGSLLPADIHGEYQDSDITVYGSTEVIGYTSSPPNLISDAVLLARVGQYAGKVSLAKAPGWVSDNALIVKFDTTLISIKFAMLLLRSLNLNDYATKTAQPLLTGSTVKAQAAPLPPLDAQASIVGFVDIQESRIEALKIKAQEAIMLLRERRSALITAAVTGQIDVTTSRSKKQHVEVFS